MNKITFIFYMFLLIFLLGCTKEYTCGDGRIVLDSDYCKEFQPRPPIQPNIACNPYGGTVNGMCCVQVSPDVWRLDYCTYPIAPCPVNQCCKEGNTQNFLTKECSKGSYCCGAEGDGVGTCYTNPRCAP